MLSSTLVRVSYRFSLLFEQYVIYRVRTRGVVRDGAEDDCQELPDPINYLLQEEGLYLTCSTQQKTLLFQIRSSVVTSTNTNISSRT